MSALVSLCSVAATAWLVTSLTAVAIGRERGQALADDTRIYDTLVGYAATHPDWAEVAPTLRELSQRTGRRIILTDTRRHPLADSAGTATTASLPATASATVDAFAVDAALAPHDGAAPADRIDPRAVGPFRLTAREREALDATATQVADCMRGSGQPQDITVVHAPNGRPNVIIDERLFDTGDRCGVDALLPRTPTENRALGRLGRLLDDCLTDRGAAPVRLADDLTWTPSTARGVPDSRAVTACLATARREQLDPYVAPAALLFATAPHQRISTFFDLSHTNRARIAGAAVLVLLTTVTVTFVAGTRMVRPLRALTDAAQRLADGNEGARVEVAGDDELGRLATAFNLMSNRREQLEKVRRAMVSDIAHELRTPLSNIRGLLEAVEDGVVPADGSVVSSLLEEALLLQHIIDDLRDLAAAEAGALRLHPEGVDATALLAQVARGHQGNAAAAGVELRVRPGEALWLHADPVRLRQAVGNLVSNAVRHTPAGGRVTLSAEPDGREVVIRVEDTGSGIGDDDLPRLFDRFWRAEKSRSRQGGGSGLGLPIVRKLAEAHGGSVQVSSRLGAGSVFSLRLPAG
ncbi:HAMP domain-containing histidine kinase [Streptomyces sp. MBT53]|nr:HAMP domain-containing histidine kinase [Streptomyces sp. MBT53]